MIEPGCELCGGPEVEGCLSGFVPGDSGTVRPCPQRAARRTECLLAAAQVPELYRSCAVAGFRSEGLRGAAQLAANREACRAYVERFVLAGPERTCRGLLFTGPVGSGKTHLLAAVLQEIIRTTGASGLFADFTALCAALQASFDDPHTSEARVMQPLLDADILALDELGARRPTPYVADTLYLLVNTRYSARRPTLFSSNHPLEAGLGEPGRATAAAGLDRPMGGAGRSAAPEASFEPLSARVGPRIHSRLYEATEPALVFDQAEDYRKLRLDNPKRFAL